MFTWARKERLSERASTQKSNKSCTQTKLHSQPSSPAHSTFSLVSPSPKLTPQKKLKIVLYTKQKPKQSIGNMATNIQNNMSKTQLMKLINEKNNTNTKKQLNTNKEEKNKNKILQNGLHNIKRPIKIKIQVNRLIDQYCRSIKQLINNNIWGIFGMGSLLLKMGFIHDLVNQRILVRDIWYALEQPDQLGLYVFLQLVLGNRIQVDMAINTICSELRIKAEQINREKAISIISMKKFNCVYEKLRINRLSRQKNIELKEQQTF